MRQKPKYEPAFAEIGYGHDGVPVQIYTGMSLRDYFAAKALQALIAADRRLLPERASAESYEYAEAMLKARGE